MNIYLAGFGHAFENTDFVKIKDDWNILLSYYYLDGNKDKGMSDRFKWVKNENLSSGNSCGYIASRSKTKPPD